MQQSSSIKIPKIEQVKTMWDQRSENYHGYDAAPQSFYFSIIHLLDLSHAKYILEVGCGRCLLVPYCLQLKSADAGYLAVDLSPKMVEQAKKRLEGALAIYHCKLSFEEWCKINKFELRAADCEDIIEPEIKFDRIICNMVLMLTTDAIKMLKSLYEQAEQGCLLAVSVWGDRQHNSIHSQMTKVVEALNIDIPKIRSNFHLYNKVEELAGEVGWKTVVKWEQGTVFPIIVTERLKFYATRLVNDCQYLSEEQKKWVFDEYMRRQTARLEEKKQPLNFTAQILILRK